MQAWFIENETFDSKGFTCRQSSLSPFHEADSEEMTTT